MITRSTHALVIAARRTPTSVHACALGILLAACGGNDAPQGHAPPSTSERTLVTAGEFQVGTRDSLVAAGNPLEEVANAGSDGKRLYLWFNCAGCHGPEGGGGIGPPLRDADWIYGGNPASIFQSIAQGRPNGMPAFGGKIPDEEIWRIEMYVRSLGGAKDQRAGGSSGKSPTEAQRSKGG